MSAESAVCDVIKAALQDFRFSRYGCDDVDEIIDDPSLDLLNALTEHIAYYLEN